MLTFLGRKERYCDGIGRRNFLQIGALGVGGLTLADLLRSDALADQQGRPAHRRRSIINIYLGGGPSHMDMFDLKPEAPAEYRGEFRPIATNVPGMEIGPHFEKLARLGDKLIIVRSLTGIRDEHSPVQTDTGWSESSLRTMGGRPGIGAVMTKLFGSVNGEAPMSVALNGFTRPGFLGPIYKDFSPRGGDSLRLTQALSADRLESRSHLLSSLDRIRADADRSGMMSALDQFNQRAVQVVTSGALAEALDVSKEDPRVLERYAYNSGESGGGRRGRRGGRRDDMRQFLVARRLIEAGVRVVSLSYGGWDTHANNFQALNEQNPALDTGLSALIEDLDARGLLEDTIVMMSGEFGRTPRINSGAGRDHWAPAAFWLVAGGGFRTGQVIGSTNSRGEVPKDRPLHLQQLYGMVYRQLGVDPETTRLIDSNGRPQYLLDEREPIPEMV